VKLTTLIEDLLPKAWRDFSIKDSILTETSRRDRNKYILNNVGKTEDLDEI
jgi:hypothetical protein